MAKTQYTLNDIETMLGRGGGNSQTQTGTKTAGIQKTGQQAYTLDDIESLLDSGKKAQQQTAAGGKNYLVGDTSSPASQRALQNAAGKTDAEELTRLARVGAAVTTAQMQRAQQAAQTAARQSAPSRTLAQLTAGSYPMNQTKAWELREDPTNLLYQGQAAQMARAAARDAALKSYAADGGNRTGAGGLAQAEQALEDYRGRQDEIYRYYNDWLDETDRTGAQPNRQLAEAVRQMDAREQDTWWTSDSQEGVYVPGWGTGEGETRSWGERKTADEQLQEMGYTQQEIDTARAYNAAYDALGAYTSSRRAVKSAEGIAKTVAAVAPLTAETAYQALENREARILLEERNPEKAELYKAVERINGSGGMYTLEDLADNSDWTIEEIRQAADELAGTAQPLSTDSVGYKLYKSGQEDTADAMRGETEGQRFLHGSVSSAAENLAVGAVNPALVLPVLSAQGAAEAMGQSAEKGQSAGKSLLGGAAKFGAGWAINSVGVTQLAESMGEKYAANQLAKDITSWMSSKSGLASLAESSPVLYNAISGGLDNSVQAFVETYADKMVDAALGDVAPDDSLFSKDTFVEAAEGALSGGLAGAMGGAVGSGIGAARAAQYESAAEEQAAALNAREGGSQAVRDADRAQAGMLAGETEKAAQAPAEADMAQALANAQETERGGNAPAQEVRTAAPETAAQRTAETAAAQEAADKLHIDLDEVDTRNMTGEEMQMLRDMASTYRMSSDAAETLILHRPEGMNPDLYMQAANSVYRLAAVGTADRYEQIIPLAGVRAQQVRAMPGGENALRAMFLQGQKDYLALKPADVYAAPGLAADGQAGKVRYSPTTERSPQSAEGALIDLSARASDNAVVLQRQLDKGAAGYIDTAVGKIYLGDRADAFGTLLHEQAHDANAWDPEGGRMLTQTMLRFVAEQRGMDSVDALVQNYLDRYETSGQELTWDQAAEELVNDGLRGIFDTKEHFEEWARHETALAQKNAESRGAWQKVKDAVNRLLDRVIRAADELLRREPENTAARWAKELAEDQKDVLRQLHYEHEENAQANKQAAREEGKNGAAGSEKTAPGERRFKLAEGEETIEKQLNRSLEQLEKMDTVASVTGKEVAYGRTNKENAENIAAFFNSVGNRVERPGFGTVELARKGAKATVQHGNGPVKQAAVAAIPEVIRSGQEIGGARNWKNRGYNTHVFAAPVQLGGETIYLGVVVNEYPGSDLQRKFYLHEVCASDGSLLVMGEAGMATKKSGATSTVLNTAEGQGPDSHSNISIAQDVGESKTGGENLATKKEEAATRYSRPLKADLTAVVPLTESITQDVGESKNGGENLAAQQKDETGAGRRYQLPEAASLNERLESLKEQERELRRQRDEWKDSAWYRQFEEQNRAARSEGLFSERYKAWKKGEMYQEYLETRGTFNRELADVREQMEPIEQQLRELGEQAEEARRNGTLEEQQAYDAQLEKSGKSRADYRRELAEKQFGTTDEYAKAGYILPDGTMLNFAENGQETRSADHREILSVLGPAEAKNGTDALNQFIADGNVRVMAEGPGVDIPAQKAPTAEQLEMIRDMADELGSGRRQFTLDISNADGSVAASKTYEGRIDSGRIVREIREYYKTGELPAESALSKYRYQLPAEDRSLDSDERIDAWHYANKQAQLDTLKELFGLTGRAKISERTMNDIAQQLVKQTGSKADTAAIAEQLRGLFDYMSSGTEVNWDGAMAAAEGIADELMSQSEHLDRELWNAHKDWHNFSVYIEKGSATYQSVVNTYGSWTRARREYARHGVNISTSRQSADGRGTRLGVDVVWQELSHADPGVFDPSVTDGMEMLDRMADVRDAIRPQYRNNYGEGYNEAKNDLAMQIVERYMTAPEMTDADMILEAHERELREVRTQAHQQSERTAAAIRAESREMLEAQAEGLRRQFHTQLEQYRENVKNDYLKKLADQQAAAAARLQRQKERYEGRLSTQKTTMESRMERQAQRYGERSARQSDKFDKALARSEGALQRSREARENDNLRRGIAKDRSTLNKWLLHPTEKQHVPAGLLNTAIAVADMADTFTSVGGTERRNRLKSQLEELRRQTKAVIKEQQGSSAAQDWTDNKLMERIDDLVESIRDLSAEDAGKGMARLNNTQLAALRDILRITVTGVRNENKLLSKAKTQKTSEYAAGVEKEIKIAKGPSQKETIGGKLSRAWNSYQMDLNQAERFFNRIGGWNEGGMTRGISEMLNQGQYRQQQIKMKGEELFSRVFSTERAEEMRHFREDKVDIGLVDRKTGKRMEINHDMLVGIYLGLHDTQNANHMLQGGITVPDLQLYAKGDIQRAYQLGARCTIGFLTEGSGADARPSKTQVLEAVEKNLTDYDKQVIAVMQEFYGKFTKGYINDTSMALSGILRAGNPNYYPIVTDPDVIARVNEGAKVDSTIEGQPFLKERNKAASTPILLEASSNVALRSLDGVAAYAGLAIPLRDAQKILNSRTEDGITLRAAIKEKYGAKAEKYIGDLLTDLQTAPKTRDNAVSRVMGKVTGNVVSAVLNANISVTLAQVASLPTAMAELDAGSTLAATAQFAKNASGKQRAALEQEIKEHGSPMIYTRTIDSARYTLSTMNKVEGRLARAQRNHPALAAVMGTNWIGTADKLTVLSLWTGAKNYVENHPAEFGEGAQEVGSEAYWDAVNTKYQQVVERTQPDYTVMQRAAIQRDPNGLTKLLTQFTTQRFQNFGILSDAIGDYAAQQDHGSAESRQRAGKKLARALSSQALQIVVFSAFKIAADFMLHRTDDERDENGDLSAVATMTKFAKLSLSTLLGGSLGGSEFYTLMDNLANGTDYDVVSASPISAVNEVAADIAAYYKLLKTDTSDLDEADLDGYHERLESKLQAALLSVSELVTGLPAENYRKLYSSAKTFLSDTLQGDPLADYKTGTTTAAAQYDRAVDAVFGAQDGTVDREEVLGALEKLEQMQQETIRETEARTDISDAAKRRQLAELTAEDAVEKKLLAGIKARLTKTGYSDEVRDAVNSAALALVEGDADRAMELVQPIKKNLYEALGIDPKSEEDAARREAVIDMVQDVVNTARDNILKDGSTSLYTNMLDALQIEGAAAAQKEIDRLLTAGKTDSAIKRALTGEYKALYVEGSETEQKRIAALLTALHNSEGKAYYTDKDLKEWVKEAKKKEEKDKE